MVAIIHTWDINRAGVLEELLLKGMQFSKLILLHGEEWNYTATVGGRENGIDDLLLLAKKQDIALDIIVGSAKESRILFDFRKLRKYNLHHWETFWLSHTYNIQLKLQEEQLKYSKLSILQDSSKNSCSFRIISLNNRPHEHRCLMIDLLSKYDLINNNAISWHEAKYLTENYTESLTSIARGYKYKYWKPEVLILDEQYVQDSNQNILPVEYQSSFCQLVIESTIEVPFITEKTCLPLFYMKPFIVASIQGYHKILERMGFKLYTELFDYSFDSIQDIEKRFVGIAENLAKINKISKQELTQLYGKISDKLKYNKEHAIMLATKLNQQPSILKEVYAQTVNSTSEFYSQFNSIFQQYT